MKKIIGWLRLGLVTAVVLIGAMGTAATMPRVASGSTAQKFAIDTRDKKFCIVDVKGDYCWGKYHSADGHGATFLNGVGLDLGFKIKADRGTGGKQIDHYEYGSRTTKTDEFRVDVGALAPGTKLEVVAVATDGTRSEPFRVNFDIASAPENSDAFHVAKKHVGVSVVYEAENLSTFDLLDDVNGFLKFFDNASDVRVLPSFSADVMVDSASGEYSRAVGAGVRVDPFANNEKMLKKMAKKIGKLAGADLDAVLIGGPTSKWNPYAQEWQEESTSVGVLLGCHVHMIKGRVPESLGIVHYAFGLEGEGEFTGTWLKDKKLNFTAAFDPLLGVTACLGAGAKILADVEGYVKGGVFLTAQGPNKPHLKELGFRGGFGWDAHMFGFKVKDGYIDWTQYLVGGPPKPAARLMNALSVAGLDDYANAQPISRDYRNAPRKARLMAAGNGTGADDERVVVENGYQWPDPTVAACGTRHVLAYLVDDPARNDINRTKLVCSVDDGTAETVWDDGTPDFKPSVGMAADGTVVLAWMNGKSAYSATATAPTVFAGSELAVAVRNVATGQWMRKNLTNDAVLDRAPLVRVTPDGKACVLWVRNAACDPFGSPTAKNEMWGAVYNGTTWGAPTKLFEMNAIGGFDFHYGRESGTLAATFAIAELNGAVASVLQSVRYGRWNGGAGPVTPQVYREIDLESANPYVYADKNGSLKLLWGEAGGIRTRTFAIDGMSLTKEDERIYAFDGDGCGAFALAKGANGQIAAVGARLNARFPWTSDPAVCHYDTNADAWSGAVALLDNDRVERSLDAVLDGSGNLIAAYASVAATKTDDGTLTYGAVDVRTLTRRAGADFAVMAEDIAFAEDSDFTNGGTAPVLVKLRNLGNVPAFGVPVRVLVGQDEESLAVVSDSALTVDFAAGGVTNVTADWIVNLNVSNLIVRVEIDPEETVNDIDRSNNAATREAVASLRVVNTRVRFDAEAKTCTLTATVFNGGFKAVPAGTVVTFEREDGTEIGRDEIGRVMPGENGLYEASIIWNLAGVSFAKSDETVTVRLMPPPGCDMEESQWWKTSFRVLTGFVGDEEGSQGEGRVAAFSEKAQFFDEGGTLKVIVNGGNADLASSVQVQAVYNTAAVADLDLKSATVNSEKPKSFKFPVTLEWAKGEIGEKTIEIPVAVDKSVEADEFLTLQLQNPMNLAIGEASACTVTIHDPKFDALKAAVESGTATKAQSNDLQKIEKTFAGKSYVRALANDATRGKVTGSALVAAGKNASLKATANKGFVFAGWYTDEACAPGSELQGYGDYRNPSLAYVQTNGAITVFARFIMPEEDGLELGADFLPAEFAVGEAVSIEVPVESVSYPTVTVGGLPSGLKYYAKETFVKAKGATPAYTIPANTIFGTPTKATTKPATVTVTVKNLGGYQITRKYEVSVVATAPSTEKAKIVSDAPPYQSVSVALSDDFAGKVTGVGVYQAGKKVTLKATANKGYVFAGWYEGEGAVATQTGEPVSSLASYVLTMPTNDVAYVAKFVTTDEDEASISADVNGFSFGAGTAGADGVVVTKFATNVMTGVYLKWPVTASALSETTVKVAGLPSGLKFTAKPITSKVTSGTVASKVTTVVTNVPANTIYGAPTKASTVDNYGEVKPSTVKVTVTTSGKSKADYVISLTVDPIPDFAVGTFDGWYSDGEDLLGSATLTLAANGKVSGKVLMPVEGKGKTYNFKADSLSGFSRADDGSVTNVTVAATLTGESKVAVPLALTFAPDEIGIGCVEGAFDSPWSGGLWLAQNGWKRGGYVFPNIPKNIVKTLDDGLMLTFKKNGVVTIGGKIVGDDGVKMVTAKGSAQLVSDPESSDGFRLLVYVPPAKNLVSGLCHLYDVKLIDAATDNVVTDVQVTEGEP